MSRGSLHFKLPEENEEFKMACQAGEYRYALSEFHEWIFFKLGKHEWPEGVDQKTVEFIRDQFREYIVDLDL